MSGEDEKEPDPKQPGSEETGGAAGSKKSGEADPPASPWAGLLKDAAKTLMPVLLTGASLIGFVAFAGAVIVWTRLYAIEVPPDQAVKAVPQAELVATGSSVLLLFGFFGVLAIVAAYLVDRSGRATPGMSRALLVLLGVEGVIAIYTFDEKATVAVVVFALIALLAVLATFHEHLARYVDELPSRPSETQDPFRGAGPLRTEEGKLRASYTELGALAALAIAAVALVAILIFVALPPLLAGFIAAYLLVIAAVFSAGICLVGGKNSLREEWRKRRAKQEDERRRKEEERQERERVEREDLEKCAQGAEPAAVESGAREREIACKELREKARMARRRPHRLRMTTPGVVLLTVLGGGAVLVPCAVVHSLWLAVPLGAAMVLGLGVWRIAVLSKSNFMWYGLVVFISVPLFGTLTLMAHNVANPQVQPLALIRSSDGPDEAIQGIYITEGDERVYFANVATEGCSDEVTPDSGRLLWVPKSEVVAMSIGPSQDVKEAGKSALEMAYTLTPSVETPAAGAVGLTVPEKRSKKLKEAEEARVAKEVEAHAPQLDQRLESPGPAVRPNFGTGLSLVPEIASPGEEVELRLSVPNEDVNGLGAAPNGHTLRLNGVPLTPIREAAPYADRAEYVKTEGGVLLSLDKRGVYGLGDELRPYPLGRQSPYRDERYVKLEDPRAEVVSGNPPKHPDYLRLKWSEDGTAELATKATVVVEKGSPEVLKPGLLRQAWHRDRIRFRVPDAASSGVVTVECDQLAGSPLLRVSHTPTARIAVRMRENSMGVTLDGSRSRDEDGEGLSRRWTIEGLGRGHRKRIATRFPPRLGAYLVTLTVTDEAGNSDTAELRLLRLRTSLFHFDEKKPKHREKIEAAAEALGKAVQAQSPQAIELDGHTDHAGRSALNMRLSLERDDRVHEMLMPELAKAPDDGAGVPVREVAYGKSCPMDPRDGSRPRNRRVDVFVLAEGVTVKPTKGCVPGRRKNTSWHLIVDAEASSGAIASPLP